MAEEGSELNAGSKSWVYKIPKSKVNYKQLFGRKGSGERALKGRKRIKMYWVPIFVSHWKRHIICLVSFNLHSQSLKSILLAPFSKWETLLKVIAPTSGETGIWTHSILPQRIHYFYYTKESIQWEKRREHSGRRIGCINIKRTSEVKWATKNYFRTCNQRDRKIIRRKCYVGTQG